MLPDNQTMRQHFRDEVPTQGIKFSLKMLTLTKNSNFTQNCMTARIFKNVEERSISYCRPDYVIITCILSPSVSFNTR